MISEIWFGRENAGWGRDYLSSLAPPKKFLGMKLKLHPSPKPVLGQVMVIIISILRTGKMCLLQRTILILD